MNKSILTSTLTALLTTTPVAAVEVVQCENTETAERGFFKHCPPNYTLVDKKKYVANIQTSEQPTLNVVHYLTYECGACDQVRDFFKLRKIQTTEKNVNDNIELQGELTLLAGELRVPTVVINDNVIQGYNRKKMLTILTELGWKKSETE